MAKKAKLFRSPGKRKMVGKQNCHSNISGHDFRKRNLFRRQRKTGREEEDLANRENFGTKQRKKHL